MAKRNDNDPIIRFCCRSSYICIYHEERLAGDYKWHSCDFVIDILHANEYVCIRKTWFLLIIYSFIIPRNVVYSFRIWKLIFKWHNNKVKYGTGQFFREHLEMTYCLTKSHFSVQIYYSAEMTNKKREISKNNFDEKSWRETFTLKFCQNYFYLYIIRCIFYADSEHVITFV